MKKTFTVEIEMSDADWEEIEDYKSRIRYALLGIVTRWDMDIAVKVNEVKGKKVR